MAGRFFSKELAHLRPRCIDIENQHIVVTKEMAKNGKERYVDIDILDLRFFKKLKDSTEGMDYCLGGVQEESLNRAIRREMKKTTVDISGTGNMKTLDEIYRNTTLHAIRKTWARKRYYDMLATRGIEPANPKYSAACREVWGIVQEQLGHEDDLRPALFATYIGDR